uniref:ATPase subunit 8 n=1 Tax=Opistholeptus burmanus TaxID=2813440 RepID=A0A8T9ZXE6_9HEMI|nr:ATPase subunit 8 [Opistholeptus burmanus]
MPQMSPMMWEVLYIVFNSLMMLTIIILYWMNWKMNENKSKNEMKKMSNNWKW